jgi:hypothetical protein
MAGSKYVCKPKDKIDAVISKSSDAFLEIVEYPIEIFLLLLA